MGRPSPRSTVLLFCFLVLTGCSTGSAPVSTNPDAQSTSIRDGGADYLRGVESQYSKRLDRLGDTELLGNDSVMRDALVGGDGSVLVAATLFRHGGMYSLDLILLNRRGEPVNLSRADIQLVDADGLWLSSRERWDEGERYGLRGKRVERTNEQVVYEMPEKDFEREQALLVADLDQGVTNGIVKRKPLRSRERREKAEEPTRGAQPVHDTIDGSPARVTVPPGDGRAFWGYFEAEAGEPSFPLTAVVLIDGEPILFNFTD